MNNDLKIITITSGLEDIYKKLDHESFRKCDIKRDLYACVDKLSFIDISDFNIDLNLINYEVQQFLECLYGSDIESTKESLLYIIELFQSFMTKHLDE